MLEGALVETVVSRQRSEGVAEEDIFWLMGPQQVALKLHILNGFSNAATRDVLTASAAVPGGGDSSR